MVIINFVDDYFEVIEKGLSIAAEGDLGFYRLFGVHRVSVTVPVNSMQSFTERGGDGDSENRNVLDGGIDVRRHVVYVYQLHNLAHSGLSTDRYRHVSCLAPKMARLIFDGRVVMGILRVRMFRQKVHVGDYVCAHYCCVRAAAM